MDLNKKLRHVMIDLSVTQVELAKRTEQSQANLSRKMIANNFTIREYEKLVKAMGCELEVNIILPNGDRV